MDDVIPFLENVTRGRNVPRERLAAVAHHYELFGGVSPINGQNRALIAALEAELGAHGIELPISFGNRNWHPFLATRCASAAASGSRRALAFFTSAFSSYSGCRQYREDIYARSGGRSRRAGGAEAARLLQPPGLHRGERRPRPRRVRRRSGERRRPRSASPRTASRPRWRERCRYEDQLARDGATRRRGGRRHGLGARLPEPQRPAARPWLEPDVLDHLAALARRGVEDVVDLPGRLRLRPPRGPLRPRRRGARPRQELGARTSSGHGTVDPPGLRRDDPRADRGAPRGGPGRAPLGRYRRATTSARPTAAFPAPGRPSPWATA